MAKRTTASTKLNEDDELLIVHAMTGEETVVMQSEKEMFLRIEAFCLALHGADLHIRSGAWSTKHGNCSSWRGCAYYLVPAEWCDFAGYSFFD